MGHGSWLSPPSCRPTTQSCSRRSRPGFGRSACARLHERQGQALHNFGVTLPPEPSDMAAQIFKDPYLFDFLGTADPRREAEVEAALTERVQRFLILIELGAGFAFVGHQVKLVVGDADFYIDLLFHHHRLRCYVVVELKSVPFQPEFTGKLALLRHRCGRAEGGAPQKDVRRVPLPARASLQDLASQALRVVRFQDALLPLLVQVRTGGFDASGFR